MTPGRNPSEERLLAYAAGVLSPPEAVVVAAHLALRPANSAWVRQLQSVGGAFLEATAPVPLSADALEGAMARIGTDAGDATAEPPLNEMACELPEPLRRYGLGPWRWMGPGVRVRDVHAPRDGASRVILLKIQPGRRTPKSTSVCTQRAICAASTVPRSRRRPSVMPSDPELPPELHPAATTAATTSPTSARRTGRF